MVVRTNGGNEDRTRIGEANRRIGVGGENRLGND